MNTDRVQLVFFLIIFAAIAIVAFHVFLPFMAVLATAIILAVVMQPFFERVLVRVKGHRNTAASIVVITICIIVSLFLSFVVGNVFNESKDLYTRVTSGDGDYIAMLTHAIETPIQKFFPEFSFDLKNYADSAVSFVKTYATSVLTTTASTIFYMFLTMVAFFFFLRDGKMFREHLISISPLKDEIDGYIVLKMKEAINAVVKGTLLIAIIQGVLVGTGLALFGVPNPTLWGSIAVIAAIIPGLGTSLIALPAIAYLVLQGSVNAAIGLVIWQVLLVGLIDNLLAPYLYGRGTNVHPVLILFSVLGGLAYFGPIGFLFGPLVVTLLFVLLHVYRVIVLQDKKVLD